MLTYDELTQIRGERERFIISKNVKYYIGDTKHKKKTLPTNELLKYLNTKIEKAKLDEDYFNPNLLSDISYIFNTVLRSAFDLTKYITGIKLIGADSVDGYAMFGAAKQVPNSFVLKVSRGQADMYHEYFVSFTGLAKLRARIPNFAIVLSTFEYNMLDPNLNNSPKLPLYNNTLPNSTYVVYETIAGMTLGEAIRGNYLSFEQLLALIIQILKAIDLAVKTCSFTHGDLHPGNIIIRHLTVTDKKDGSTELNKKIIYIPYIQEDGTTIYIKSPGIATIIDFGRSHVKYEGEHYGTYGFDYLGLYPDKTRPFYDIHQLLFGIGAELLQFDNENGDDKSKLILSKLQHPIIYKLFYLLSPFYEEITKSNIASFIDDKYKSETGLYIGPAFTQLERKMTIQNYIDHIQKSYPNEWKNIIVLNPPKRATLIECKNFCKTEIDELHELIPNLSTSIYTTPDNTNANSNIYIKIEIDTILSEITSLDERITELKTYKQNYSDLVKQYKHKIIKLNEIWHINKNDMLYDLDQTAKKLNIMYDESITFIQKTNKWITTKNIANYESLTNTVQLESSYQLQIDKINCTYNLLNLQKLYTSSNKLLKLKLEFNTILSKAIVNLQKYINSKTKHNKLYMHASAILDIILPLN